MNEFESASVSGVRESFGEKICDVVFGRAVSDDDVTGDDAFADEVMTNVDVFGTRMELVVVCESYGGLVVCEKRSRASGEESEF